MPKGPILSQTLNLINEGPSPDTPSAWAEHISRPENYDVRLMSPAGEDELSDAERSLIDDVFKRFGDMNRWALVDLVHTFPEWQDPDGSALPITYLDNLLAGSSLTELSDNDGESSLRRQANGSPRRRNPQQADPVDRTDLPVGGGSHRGGEGTCRPTHRDL